MKVGDKVVCIDAKDQRVGDIKAPIPVIKGKEYLITEIINYGYGLNVKGATAVYKEWTNIPGIKYAETKIATADNKTLTNQFILIRAYYIQITKLLFLN